MEWRVYPGLLEKILQTDAARFEEFGAEFDLQS
jgi:hypothetical protein